MSDWGRAERHRPVIIGNDRWVCGKLVREWNGEQTLGLTIDRHIDAMNGGNEIESWWAPLTAFTRIAVKIEGIKTRG